MLTNNTSGVVSTDDGAWTNIATASGNFSSDSGTWTVDDADITDFSYKMFGKTMHVNVTLGTTTIASAPTTLLIKIPASKTAARRVGGVALGLFLDNGTQRSTGFAFVANGATNISILKDKDATAFTASTNATSIQFQIMLETTT